MPNETWLQLALQHRAGSLTLDVAFALTAPWTVLFGASGSGKTTILRSIQGLTRPAAGHIVLGTQTVLHTEQHLFVPAHRRNVRSAAQAARLFPGKTIRENIAFGSTPDIASQVLELLQLETLAHTMPASLSGGEQQRASVARAVAAAAAIQSLLLLDEPFAGLDLALRDVLAPNLQRWLQHRNIPVLSVTHDVGEVFLLGAEVIRLQNGRIVQQGPASQTLAAERTRLLVQLQG